MNNLDKQYLSLLQDIRDNGIKKSDRTGTGTVSVFGRQIRHKMSEGFPILTTKKVYWKGVVEELLWFLRGETNIQSLVKNNVNIWVGDAYKKYCKICSANSDEFDEWLRDNGNGTLSMYTQEQFIEKIKTDDVFAEKWGDLGPVYGKQWRKWERKVKNKMSAKSPMTYYDEVDQISNLINDLKTNPDSRRLMVNAWNVAEIDEAVLPPCHYGFQLWTRELSIYERRKLPKSIELCNEINGDKLIALESSEMDDNNIPKRAISLMFNARSQDVPLGTPFNLSSYGLLLCIIAKKVNMIPDELIENLGDAHIYLNQLDAIEEQLNRKPFNLPIMKISDKNIDDISEYLLEDFSLIDYQYHASIKIPLSN